jgi:multicomponent Na+:H+ antiporter subunit C
VSEAPETLYLLVGAGLFALGIAGVFRDSEPLRRIIAVNVMGSGVFLFLVAVAARAGDPPDPVPHAMVLTGIVVAVCATAVALTISDLARRSDDGDRDEEPSP